MRVRIRSDIAWLLIGILTQSSAGAANAVPAVSLDCSSASSTLQVPSSGVATITSGASGPAWFDVAEQGFLLAASADAGVPVQHIGVPYRYGLHSIQLAPGQSLTIKRIATSRQPATAQISVDCTIQPAVVQRRDWLAEVAAVTAPLTAMLPAQRGSELLARIDQLATTAAVPADLALARHVRAQVLLLSSRSADSADAFATAATAWMAAGDAPRARVARVGQVEDLQRLARHQDALALVDDVSPALARSDYFAARLRLSRCLTLRYLGRMNDALSCFRDGADNMERLGETLDLVSASQDMADVSRYLGHFAEARALGERALAQATLPDMAVHRGRIHLLLADIALEGGDIGQALVGFNDALTEFAAAANPRWEANALLRTAELYVSLGGLEEASDFVAAALSRLNERDAPARIAAARVTQARIDMQTGRIDRARSGLQSAIDTYARLSMAAELDSTRLGNARLLLQIGDRAGVAAAVATRDTTQTLNRDDWRLLEARLLSATSECVKALAIVAELEPRSQRVERQLERVQVRAECLAAGGRADQAEQALMSSARRIATLAQRVDSALLRQVIAGYIAPLRRTAFRLAAAANGDKPVDADNLWRWLQLDEAALLGNRSSGSSQASSRFDEEVSRELLAARSVATRPREDAAPRHLLAMLAARPESNAHPIGVAAEVSLAALQARLGDAMLLSYVDAGAHSALMLISRETVRLLPTAEIASLRSAADQLTRSISDRSSAAPTIAADSTRLSSLLWPSGAAVGPAPAVLLIDASSALTTVPWAVLNWPGSDQPLLETTRISIARIDNAPRAATAKARREVAVFVAGQENNPALATLWNARLEPGLIQTALGEGGRVSTLPANDREALIGAFTRPQPSLHIAAHGGTLPSRIGYAGIWLEAAGPQLPPRFVSWLEILARGSSNELVVLNACQLAETRQGSAAGLNFADAVSQAGARDVVAARWQVSDGATTLWVPAFYRAIGEGRDVGDALHQAQQRLRDSRVFRHPFYWAAYVHYGHF